MPSSTVLSEHEREVLRLLETPWGGMEAALERVVLSRLDRSPREGAGCDTTDEATAAS